MNLSPQFVRLIPLLTLLAIALPVRAATFYDDLYDDLPPSYEEAMAESTYTINLQPGDDKYFSISEFLRLSSQGYSTVRIKVGSTSGWGWGSGWRTSDKGSKDSYNNRPTRIPHCRLLKQDRSYYRVLLDNTIYESNLSYDDAILLIGKLVSLDACRF